jgi:hypothetical protein
MKKIILLVVGFLLHSCTKENSRVVQKQDSQIQKPDSVLIERKDTVQKNLSKEETLKKLNDGILKALKAKDYRSLADNIHPEKGVRFSMYGYINPARDKKFSLSDFRKYVYSNTKFTFGERDGSGDIYVVSIKDYLAKWVFKRDFTTGQYLLNHFRGEGNSLNNLKEIYPGADFTENYIAGSEKYSGMDWNSLRLVFEEFNGRYYLIAVVNDEWTI